jgi:hypothetical protein
LSESPNIERRPLEEKLAVIAMLKYPSEGSAPQPHA